MYNTVGKPSVSESCKKKIVDEALLVILIAYYILVYKCLHTLNILYFATTHNLNKECAEIKKLFLGIGFCHFMVGFYGT